jgi:hypothetical protein
MTSPGVWPLPRPLKTQYPHGPGAVGIPAGHVTPLAVWTRLFPNRTVVPALIRREPLRLPRSPNPKFRQPP